MKLEFISKSLDYLKNGPYRTSDIEETVQTISGVTDGSQALTYYEPKGDK